MARQNKKIVEIETIVGSQLFSTRLNRGMSRADLGNSVDVTQQQIQKYEDGSNRISLGRFYLICKNLGIKPSAILDGIDDYIKHPIKVRIVKSERLILELNRSFLKIKSNLHQESICKLAKTFSKISGQTKI